MEQLTSRILAALETVSEPDGPRSLTAGKMVRNIRLLPVAEAGSSTVALDIVLGYPARSQFAALRDKVTAAVQPVLDAGVTLRVDVRTEIQSHAVQRGLKTMTNVKNIIVVASGKGGVGKSTTAVNLALGLAAEGAVVGMLDADIYGPSQPMMLGIQARPESYDGKTMEPLENHGIQVSSIGFMVDPEEPMVWRGPIVVNALQQLLNQTNWRDLDYLIVDMPPGTGDIQLTLSQKVPVTGAVIVTTPQAIALLDARKGLRMFEKVGVPILGIVENMSVHVCSRCGHAEPIFGEGGGEKISAQYEVELLARLPLTMAIRQQTDAGSPTVVAHPDSPEAGLYREMARKVAARVATRVRDSSGVFPTIVIKND